MAKPVQLIFLSDTHLGFDYPLRPRVAISHRGEDFFRNFITILNYALDVRADLVVHGGDLFFRSRVPGAIIDRAYQILIRFVRSGIPLFIIPGNHERSALPQPLLIRHPGLFVFNRPRTYSIRCAQTAIALSGFPYVRTAIRKNFTQILKSTGWKTTGNGLRILCLHQLIEGATVGPKGYRFSIGSDVIRRAELPVDAHIILAGHIHRRQESAIHFKGRPDPLSVLYAGSTERTSFAEKDERKGFYHLIFHQQPRKDWRIRHKLFIPLPTRPMIDLMIDRFRSPAEVEEALRSSILGAGGQAIIRLNIHEKVEPEIVSCLRSDWLRRRLPASVQVVFSKNLFK
jgi:DNA repair exonuclease SbcCD nuclease subunit